MPNSWDFDFNDRGRQGQGGVTISVNPEYASRITNRLEPYKNFPNHLRPALEKVANYVTEQMIPRTFAQEGPGWRKLARRTISERRQLGYGGEHPILVRSGDLLDEITKRSHPKHIEIIKVGSNSRIEVGGSSEKFMRNQGGNWVYHIPARPMIPGTGSLPLPERDRRNIHDILNTEIRKQMKITNVGSNL